MLFRGFLAFEDEEVRVPVECDLLIGADFGSGSCNIPPPEG